MTDIRRHRGPHPQDRELFAPAHHDALRSAVRDLSWLLTRGYALPSSLKLTGDRHGLAARQRLAVQRCACSDEQFARRRSHQAPLDQLSAASVDVDGFNLLTTIEAALAGGVLLLARDGCLRDMASMHGSYRSVEETRPALELVGDALVRWRVHSVHWKLDQPVSNSGRLKALLERLSADRSWNWTVELAPNPDPLLMTSQNVVFSADSVVIDGAERWFNAARVLVEQSLPKVSIVNLSLEDD